jgi:hypothetical protein
MKRTILAAALVCLVSICAAREAHAAISVESVLRDGPAEAAGLQAGDQIVRLDGHAIANMDDLRKATAAHEPGDTVPITVLREGQETGLSLTFGQRPEGGASIGVMLAVSIDPSAGPTQGTGECLGWIDKTYRVDSMMKEMNLDLAETYQAILACVQHDTQRMTEANAIKYCDNVFKVHCSAVDVLTEIGEAQVDRCETLIEDSLGLKLRQYDSWRTCGQNKVYDRYSMAGEASDEDSCKSVLLDDCGTNIDAAIETDQVSADQRDFVDCCSAEGLDLESRGGRCGMIDDGFSRGPCLDRPVCVDRLTSEWIHCSVLER